jgi:hypothetical protein
VQKVFETILKVSGEGVTILLIEQNAKLALEVSNRGYVMESGEITLSGETAKLLHDPAVRSLILARVLEVACLMPDPAPGIVATPPAAPPQHLEPRVVPWRNALTWFEVAMRLVKRRPAIWALLAFFTLVSEFVLQAMPGFGPSLGKIVVPLLACGMLYAAAGRRRRRAAADSLRARGVPGTRRGDPCDRHRGVLTFCAEALAAWWIADVNLLATESSGSDLTAAAIGGIYAIGILASLPLTFVPFHALFERVRPGAAFAASVRGFLLNTVPLLVYGAVSLVLLAFGLLTMGVGLVFVPAAVGRVFVRRVEGHLRRPDGARRSLVRRAARSGRASNGSG